MEKKEAIEKIKKHSSTNACITILFAHSTYLAYKRCNPDYVINRVGKESNEDVALPVNLASVDFIEQCHHNECVEDHGEMYRGRVRGFCALSIINVKYDITFKKMRKSITLLLMSAVESTFAKSHKDESTRLLVHTEHLV